MLLDPLEQVSSTTVLHDNTQEAVSWKNRVTLPNLHRNKVIILCPNEFKVSWWGTWCVFVCIYTFKCLPECHNMRMFHPGQQDSLLPRTLMFGPIL